MATRIYLPSSGYSPAPISPAFGPGWEKTSSAGRRRAATVKGASPMATSTTGQNVSAGDDVLMTQYVFGPVAAQTISGTLKGQIRASENSTNLDARAQVLAKVVSGDGGTLRGTLLAMDTAALSSEFASTLTNRKFPRGGATALTNVVAQNGDWVVIELGYRHHALPIILKNASLRYGEAAGSDLAEDETSTADNAPWLEFSLDIVMYKPAGAMLMGGV